MVPDERASLDDAAVDDATVDDAPLDAEASAALIDAQRVRVAAATAVNGRLLFGVWGAAWLVGFGALYSVATDPPLLGWPTWLAGSVFAGLLVLAMVVTGAHIATRTAGVRGVSASAGAMYGWAWFVSFAGVFALGAGLARAGASPEIRQLVMTIVPLLLVGGLYMAGGAIWGDRAQFGLGVWIAAVAMVAAVVGPPHLLLVAAIAGGGGLLTASVLEHLRRVRTGSRTAR